MTIIVPNSASVYAACAVVPNSANRWAWLGFQSVPAGASGGSMIWFAGSAVSDGSPMLPIVVASGGGPVMFGPFNSPVGFFAACITTGCAIIWLKTAC